MGLLTITNQIQFSYSLLNINTFFCLAVVTKTSTPLTVSSLINCYHPRSKKKKATDSTVQYSKVQCSTDSHFSTFIQGFYEFSIRME
jgi:hypothetical protein